MEPALANRSANAFTLVELLVVIGIIAILAALLLPVFPSATKGTKIAKAKTEINGIVAAINQYESTYSRLPASATAIASVNASSPDFTFGTATNNSGSALISPAKSGAIMPAIYNLKENTYQAANSDVMAILLDITNFPGSTIATSNPNHIKNPQQLVFLNAKMTGDTFSPGIGSDLIYRDPWGNPYIISLDLNTDGKTRDGFYCQSAVSAPGLGALTQSDSANPDSFEAAVSVMVWSLGPDGQADAGAKSNAGANKDNVTSW